MATPTLRELIAALKVPVPPTRTRPKANPSHLEWEVDLVCDLPGEFFFSVRVNAHVAESFSLILSYSAPGIRRVPIVRVNGDHGWVHPNDDGSVMEGGPHVHGPLPAELDLVADGIQRDGYAVAIQDTVLTPLQAWSHFCAATNVADDPEIRRGLAQIRGISKAEQPSLFDEE